ncbi:MAG: thiamine-phosphate kinase [Candidatus Bathyarchaeia archaeon]
MELVQDLGERKIIELIVSRLDKLPDMPVPFGDDVTAVRIDDERLAVLKTDMLVGGLDVPPGMTPYQVARKAVVMNVSDFAAKGVQPLAMLVSLGLHRGTPRRDVEELALGLNAGAREYGAYLIGGDTSEAPDLIIACMVFGVIDSNRLVKRSGAKVGDIVAVTGPFGKTAAGLKLLLEKLDAPAELKKRLLEPVYLPKARLKEGLALSRSGVVTSSIDSSDGLAVSLYELHKMSGRGFEISRLPIAYEAEEFAEIHKLDVKELVLYGGEEYELVVTIDPNRFEKAMSLVQDVGGTLIPIGLVTDNPTVRLRNGLSDQEISPRGWEHFKSSLKA